jgi:hypothetical protein
MIDVGSSESNQSTVSNERNQSTVSNERNQSNVSNRSKQSRAEQCNASNGKCLLGGRTKHRPCFLNIKERLLVCLLMKEKKIVFMHITPFMEEEPW